MEKIYYQTIKETLYHEVMANGLQVYLMPKPDFTKTYGLFTTNFGSIDTTFVPINETEMITVPDGVAHYLEHKMFDMDTGDASNEFAKLGASSNAFTSNTRTAYLFSTTSHEKACVNLLLDFVQECNVTQESVEKERGIIGQEIGMYDDNPDWQSYFGGVRNLYHNHPVRIDIAGTVESIAKIDAPLLHRIYNTFYHPSNMMLFVAGHFDADEMMEEIRNNQARKHFSPMPPIIRGTINEPAQVDVKSEVKMMDVTVDKVAVNIKINDTPKDTHAKLKRELAFTLLTDMLFSKSSSLREEWSNQGLINDSFSAGLTQERDYAFYSMSCDSDHSDKLRNKLHELTRNMKDYQIDEEVLERVKKKNIGILIQAFNSLETVANMFSRYYFEGINAFTLIDEINAITASDIEAILPLFNDEYSADYTIVPIKK